MDLSIVGSVFAQWQVPEVIGHLAVSSLHGRIEVPLFILFGMVLPPSEESPKYEFVYQPETEKSSDQKLSYPQLIWSSYRGMKIRDSLVGTMTMMFSKIEFSSQKKCKKLY